MCPYQLQFLVILGGGGGGGEGLPFFFWSRGGCQKILYDVGGPGIFKKIAPLKKYPLPLLQQYAY